MASIRERNGKFNVIYSYTNEKGERKQKWETYETKAEAKRRKKEIEYKKEMGSFVVRKCKTLDELITEYVALYGKENWALSTYEGNVSLINNYILPIIGDTKLSEINTRFIERYYQSLLKRRAVINPLNKTSRNEFISSSTVRDINKLLRNCFISNEDLPVFTREFLPELESMYQIQKIGYVPENYLPAKAAFRVYLDLPQQDLITCDLVADYGNDQIYHVFDANNRKNGTNRNVREEAKVAAVISGYCNAFDDRTGNPVAANDEECMFELLTSGLEAFEEVAEVFISDRLKKIRVIQPPKITMGVTLKENLLNFQIESENINLDELAYILSKYDRKKKFYRLKSGDITLPKFRAPYLDEQLRHGTSLSIQKGKSSQADCFCRFRIALTGTPVENHLSELWSIFDYLMPGYLYSYKRFHTTFEIPIVQAGSTSALERLQKLIAPFVLRRLKKDVLKDLPEKLEKNTFTPLAGEQSLFKMQSPADIKC